MVRANVVGTCSVGFDVLFLVEVSNSQRTWTLRKDYSEFVAFYDTVVKESSTVKLPPASFYPWIERNTEHRCEELDVFIQELALQGKTDHGLEMKLLDFLSPPPLKSCELEGTLDQATHSTRLTNG